jgi:signal transduction histidine kinase/DNA-binding response OmpR family regulator
MIHNSEGSYDSFFKLLFEESPHPYLILQPDSAFTIIAVNERYLHATGTQRDAIVGHGLFEIFPDNPNDKSVSGVGDLHMSLNRVVSDRQFDTMGVQKYDIPKRDGTDGFEVKYWSPVNTPVFANDGSVAYIIHHVEDVTEFILGRERANLENAEQLGKIEAHAERMEAEVMRRASEVKDANRALKTAMQKLELREMELAAANLAKDSFLATMSHEIRTPLTGMLGMLELLSMTRLDKEQLTTLDAAWDSGRGLLRIVSDILDWSKIDEGKLELSPRPTSIQQLLQEVINTYSRVASTKALLLSSHVDFRLSPAHIVDPLRLSQILNNFVSNAIKFTEYGQIQLNAELVEQLDSGERIRFSVKDTGVGIAKDAQEHIFQRYRQESADTARMYGGTGLGLAICRRLAEMLDGKIELKSELGLGSVFSITLTLPVSDIPADAVRNMHPDVKQREVKPLFAISAEAPLVLAVDDHPTNRDLLARQIRLLGLRAETAENGQVALSMWREKRFALIITDCHMPEMDGYELAQEIRKIESAEDIGHTPIIAWTANALAEEAGHCNAAGMDDLLVKPANLALLKQTLAKWLSIVESSSEQANSPQLKGINKDNCPIDYSVLDMVVTDRAGQLQLLTEFRLHMSEDYTKLVNTLEQSDFASIESTSHRMKGSCQMVGAKNLAKACAVIEQAARNSDLVVVSEAKSSLDEAIVQLETFLAELENRRVLI